MLMHKMNSVQDVGTCTIIVKWATHGEKKNGNLLSYIMLISIGAFSFFP